MVLRIDSTSHHRVNETSSPEVYTTNDKIVRFLLLLSVVSVFDKQVLRSTLLIFQNTTSRPLAGSRTPASMICNLSSLCSTLTFARPSLLYLDLLVHTPSHSVPLIGMVSLNLSSTTNEKGTYKIIVRYQQITYLQTTLDGLSSKVRQRSLSYHPVTTDTPASSAQRGRIMQVLLARA